MPEPVHESSKYQIKVGRFSSHSQILNLAGQGQGKAALDFGCHDGELAALLKSAGWTIDGLDCDVKALQEASKVCRNVATVDVELADPKDFGTYDLLILLTSWSTPLRLSRFCVGGWTQWILEDPSSFPFQTSLTRTCA